MIALALLLAAAPAHPPVHRHRPRVSRALPARRTGTASREWSSVETYGTADARPGGPPDQSPGWGSYQAQARAVDAVGAYGAYGAGAVNQQDGPTPRD